MRYLPTIRNVNLLYLVLLILVVTVGSVVQAWSPGWGLVITEIGLILFPSLIFLKIIRFPVGETVRLHWPGARYAGLSLLIGTGSVLVAQWLSGIVTSLFGYSFALPPEFYPRNLVDALVLFSSLAILAPVCEEFLFRGIIQRGYLRRGPWAAIVIVGFYFALYHLSFERLVVIAPVALVLGYVAWRSDSLISSILVHFSYNALSGIILLVNSFRPDIDLNWFGTFPVALVGLALGAFGLWAFAKPRMNKDGQNLSTPTPTSDLQSPLYSTESSSWLARAWPIAGALLIFMFMAGLEFFIGRFPEILAAGRLELAREAWQAPVTWNYELRNVLDQPVGQSECTLSAGGTVYSLQCSLRQEAFEARQGSSFYKTGAFEIKRISRWEPDSLLLVDGEGTQQGEPDNLEWAVRSSGDGLILSVTQGGKPLKDLSLPAGSFLEGEWPWRLQALPFSLGYSRWISLARPLLWSEEAQASVPQVVKTLLVVEGAEPLATPAGNFIAWRVKVGDQTAWYDADIPHTLLQYDNGIERFMLVK